MASKSELKRRATVDPLGTAQELHALQENYKLIKQALNELISDCEIWKLSIMDTMGAEGIDWESLDVAKELLVNLEKTKK